MSEQDKSDRCPPFSSARLEKQLSIDRFLRSAVIMLIALLLFMILAEAALAMASGGQTVIVSQFFVFVVFSVWFVAMMVNSKVVQQLPAIALLIGEDIDEAERQIALAMRRKPLQDWVRLSLYHQLAVIRHHQRRFDEAAAICQKVLGYELGPADRGNKIASSGNASHSKDAGAMGDKQAAIVSDGGGQLSRHMAGAGVRAHLLLMLIDSHLQMKNMWHAYGGLMALHDCRLNLSERLQLLLLQKRYEVMSGRDEAAVMNVEKTIELAEVMPAVQCGVMHAILATSARRLGRGEMAKWLEQRAKLMLTDEQLSRIWGR